MLPYSPNPSDVSESTVAARTAFVWVEIMDTPFNETIM